MTFECQGSRITGKPLFSIISDLHEAIEAAATKVLLITFPLEQNDEWSLNRRYVQLEALQTLSDNLYRLACPLWLAESAYLSSSGLWTYTMRWENDRKEVRGYIEHTISTRTFSELPH